jgi:steroid 5-alpha reductase family enzyme
MSPWQLLLAGWAIAALLMLILWLISLRTRNAAIVDFGWAAGLALIGLLYGLWGGGDPTRRALVVVMSGLWGWRLALYLFVTRVVGKPEEGRYQKLREDWRPFTNAKFLLFFQVQGLLDVLLSVAFLMPAMNTNPVIAWWEWASFGLWILAFAGECTADYQLHIFKNDPVNKGKTCRRGLWNYSRHPNYFFESLIWIALFLFALPSPYGFVAAIGPIIIIYFLFRITGIPATEEQALRTKGDDYREYQRTTSAFVPWFKKG